MHARGILFGIMEREPQSPEQRHKAMVQAYAISFYEFMMQFPASWDPDWEATIRYVEWVASTGVVQVNQVGDEYSVQITGKDYGKKILEITQDYAEYAEAVIFDEPDELSSRCVAMSIGDWEELYSSTQQYDAWAQSWPPQQLEDEV